MQVSLTPKLEEFVEDKVAAGLYESLSEVIREGLRLLSQRDALQEAQLRDLREELAVGLRQARRGQLRPVDGTTFARVRARGQVLLGKRG
jgi:antitoxin ParD1/3/4